MREERHRKVSVAAQKSPRNGREAHLLVVRGIALSLALDLLASQEPIIFAQLANRALLLLLVQRLELARLGPFRIGVKLAVRVEAFVKLGDKSRDRDGLVVLKCERLARGSGEGEHARKGVVQRRELGLGSEALVEPKKGGDE
jgi:hypothetical protein